MKMAMSIAFAGKADGLGGLFDGLPAAEDHGVAAAPKSQAVPQADFAQRDSAWGYLYGFVWK